MDVIQSEGMFLAADGAVYRVVRSRTSGNLYTKRLNTRGGFEYAPGAMKHLTEADRMTLEQAQAFGRRYGVCAHCGRELVDPASIAAGIGPVCAKGEDGYWTAAERTAAKVALDWDTVTAEMRAIRQPLAEANRAAAPEPEVQKPAGTLTVDGSKATLVSDYDPALVAACRAIPGRKYNGVDKTNTFPVNDESTPALRAMVDTFGLELKPADALPSAVQVQEAVAQRTLDEQAREQASNATDADVTVDGLGGVLMPFQKAGVAYAATNGSVLIGDEMGLGKTVQALAALEATQSFPALVIAPAVVKVNWQRETTKWLPGRTVQVLEGRKATEVLDADVTIVNYDVVAARLQQLKDRRFAAIVCDESHMLKNTKAQRTKAVKQLAKGITLRLLLTGTPVLNRPVELASQLDILGHLEDFGGFWGFAKRYCGAVHNGYGWDFGGASNLDELHTKLRRTCYVRRTKAQVLTELPAKVRATVPLELSATDRKEYERVADDLRVFIQQKLERDVEFAELIADLDPDAAELTTALELEARERKAMQAEVLTRINALRQTTARLKLDQVCGWVQDFVESGEKLVLFAHHQEIVDGLLSCLQSAGIGAVAVRGGHTAQARQSAVDAFQNDPDVRVFVGTIGAAGVGITLTAASNVAFVELPWRPGDVDQAEDRCHRIGQTDSVTAWYLLAANTMDEDMAALLDEKRGVVEAATDGRTVASTSIMQGLLASILKEA